MLLPAGTRLGPYVVVGPLGAGGMGVVYRARDSRLGRDVAVKVLPAAYAADHERLHRFELEAQAAGRLNHPNILAVFDVGTHDGAPYLVTELLEGQTLRERLGDAPLPVRKAVEYAIPIAHGLAAAHDKGIVHRDLKPENIFLTRDGRLKILDFGLAKLLPPAVGGAIPRDAPTVTVDTDPGTVMGTVNYMSPEQVRGQAVDHRTDIFSLGMILYEMLAGTRAFRRDSAVETMNAILKEEPPELSTVNPAVPPALERVVRHCLEKSPEKRFQSARDLAFDLEALSGVSGSGRVMPVTNRRRVWSCVLGLALVSVIAAALMGAYVAGRRSGHAQGQRAGLTAGKRIGLEEGKRSVLPAREPPKRARAAARYDPLTFRRGWIFSARFANEETIYYGAAWEGQPIRLYETRSGHTDPPSRYNGTVLAISSDGEMIVSTDWRFRGGWLSGGRPERLKLPLGGEDPKPELDDDVFDADLVRLPNGSKRMVVVRRAAGAFRLELRPSGEKLYVNPGGWIGSPRFSPRGDSIAFIDHKQNEDDAGDIAIVDRNGKKRTLARGWNAANGLAWSANGKEVWFTADDNSATNTVLRAVTVEDAPQRRVIARGMGRMRLLDVSPRGRVLLTRDQIRHKVLGRHRDMPDEVDFSHLDGTITSDLSDDGGTLVFFEQAGAGGTDHSPYTAWMRPLAANSRFTHLGEGFFPTLARDRSKRLVVVAQDNTALRIVSESGAKAIDLRRGSIAEYHCARWIPNRSAILFSGNAKNRPVCLYEQMVPDGEPRAVTPEGVGGFYFAISPDGTRVAAVAADRRIRVYLLWGHALEVATKLPSEELLPVRWADNRSLYVRPRASLPLWMIDRVDLQTGRRERCRQLKPTDPAGISDIFNIVMSAAGDSYAYTYFNNLSELYLVDGLE